MCVCVCVCVCDWPGGSITCTLNQAAMFTDSGTPPHSTHLFSWLEDVVAVDESLCQVVEHLPHIVSSSSARLQVTLTMSLGQLSGVSHVTMIRPLHTSTHLFSMTWGHCPLILEVTLVPHYHHGNIV